MKRNVVIFLADGTEECEALLVVDLLRRAGAHVTLASVGTEKTVMSSHGIALVCDVFAHEIDADAFDMMVLPGGVPGTPNLAANEAVVKTLRAFYAANKPIASICAAPSILGALGMLDGKHATAHVAFQDKLGTATVHDAEVVIDGNLITSYGLGGAIPFALCLVAQLFGEYEAEKIKVAIAYRHPVTLPRLS